MDEFTRIASGIRFGQIITKSMIYMLIRDSEGINIFRSGVYFAFGDLSDVILRACEESTNRKTIRFILPSIFNEDVIVRAREVGASPEEVLAKLADWQETLAKLGQNLHPNHSLELRTTIMRPHRYHTICSEHGGILGPAWYFKASLTTSSFTFGKDAEALLDNCHEDFQGLWVQSTPYLPGDNERNRRKNVPRQIDDPDLLDFSPKTRLWVIEAMKYIVSAFPVADGSGATKQHLSAKFGTNDSTCNKRLLEMEDAGLVRKVGDGTARDRRHGRVATRPGARLAEKYRYFPTELSR